MKCKDCQQIPAKCICADVDAFFARARSATSSGRIQCKVPNYSNAPQSSGRCLACFFDPCRCKPRLEKK